MAGSPDQAQSAAMITPDRGAKASHPGAVGRENGKLDLVRGHPRLHAVLRAPGQSRRSGRFRRVVSRFARPSAARNRGLGQPVRLITCQTAEKSRPRSGFIAIPEAQLGRRKISFSACRSSPATVPRHDGSSLGALANLSAQGEYYRVPRSSTEADEDLLIPCLPWAVPAVEAVHLYHS